MEFAVIKEPLFLYPLIAGIALTAACSVLSVLIVLKRLAFIGQGITHAGFGGVGLAAFLALSAWWRDLTIFLFCIGSAIVIALLGRHRRVMMDTSIGILLVAAMGLGFLLDRLRIIFRGEEWYIWLTAGRRAPTTQWDQVLFGSIFFIQWTEMWVAIGVSTAILLILALLSREIMFYAFDETVSRVFGVRTTALHYLVLVMIAAMIVITMKLAGLLLVTALLIIPGATALLLSRNMWRVLLLSVVIGQIGMIGGYLFSILFLGGELAPGPPIVIILALLFAAALGWSRLRRT